MIKNIFFRRIGDGVSQHTSSRRSSRRYVPTHSCIDSSRALTGQEDRTRLADCRKRSFRVQEAPTGEFQVDAHTGQANQVHVRQWRNSAGVGPKVYRFRQNNLPAYRQVIRHCLHAADGVFLCSRYDNIIIYKV